MGLRSGFVPMSADVSNLEGSDRSTRKHETARSRWRWFPARFAGPRRRDSLEVLADHYATEARLARQLAQHAECLSGYPDASRRLLALAARTESYREVLAYTIERMSGQIPSLIPNPRDGRSNWERLLIDRDDLTATLEGYVDSAYALEREHPELTALLLAIRARRALDRQELLRLLARFEPMVVDRADGCVPGSAEAETGLASDTEWVPPARFSGPLARRAEPGALERFGQPVGALAAAGLQDWEDPA
jgi:hypothetical protein